MRKAIIPAHIYSNITLIKKVTRKWLQMVGPSTFQCLVRDKDHQLYLKSLLHPHAHYPQ